MLAATVSHSLTARVARSLTAARAVHASYHLSLRHLVTDRVSERGTAIGHDRPFVPAHFNRDFENITQQPIRDGTPGMCRRPERPRRKDST